MSVERVAYPLTHRGRCTNAKLLRLMVHQSETLQVWLVSRLADNVGQFTGCAACCVCDCCVVYRAITVTTVATIFGRELG